MRLKVTLKRRRQPTDLQVTAEAHASVADVARMLYQADPNNREVAREVPSDLTLQVIDPRQLDAPPRQLEDSANLVEAGLQSGSLLELVRVPKVDDAARQPLAVVRVTAGTDAGQEFYLPAGSSVVGRNFGSDVRLHDPMVSKQHARIVVGDHIEIVDLNSANGVFVAAGQVSRARLEPSDTVELGDTSFSVALLRPPSAPAPSGNTIEHVRSPRVVPRYPGEDFQGPELPEDPRPARFPMIALMPPLIMAVTLYAFTRQPITVVMMAMMPLMMIGMYLDQKMNNKAERQRQEQNFRIRMESLTSQLEAERVIEREVRRTEFPGFDDLVQDAFELGQLLWTTRPEHEFFMQTSFGLGTMPSRNRVIVPSARKGRNEFLHQVEQLAARFKMIDRVPVVADLRRAGGIGVAGPAPIRDDVARAVVLRLLATHAPGELNVCAFVSPSSLPDWEWIKWTPHVSDPQSLIGEQHLADSVASSATLLDGIEGMIATRLTARKDSGGLRGSYDPSKPVEVPSPAVPSVLVVVLDDAAADRGRLNRLAEIGPDVGVHVLWSAPALNRLPAACRSFVVLNEADASFSAGNVRTGEMVADVEPDFLPADVAKRLGRIMAPVVDAGFIQTDDTNLPRSESYVNLTGRELLDDPDWVIERWKQNQSLTPRGPDAPAVPERRRAGNLRAVIGRGADGDLLTLDLRTEGPHALVGGTTGSGKSEFLQSWVLGMAAANSPDRLTFLFVDYKGGSAFAECVDLPHSVGIVTDLTPHLVRRALTSLRAELHYRERLLQQKDKAKDLMALERTGDPDTPPSLIIVVDEFAALVNEVPAFVDGVVDVAQRGRSLGLHLILATQRPAGVIKDNLRANTPLRIALRMADIDDSRDVLEDPMAAHFDPSIPGRAAVKTGPGRIRIFQTGYAGGHTTNEPEVPRIEVAELGFGHEEPWEAPEPTPEEAARIKAERDRIESSATDIARIVDTLGSAAERAGVPEPRKPWLPELARLYNLEHFPKTHTDAKLPLGVVDDPAHQSQPAIHFVPDAGNLAIFGSTGSGKSVALRTIAAAASFTSQGGPTHIYALDFGSGALQMLEPLPHVGAVISGDDDERVFRLIRMLRSVVDDRLRRYADARSGSIAEYREISGRRDEPRILLLVDGIGPFREKYEFGSVQYSSIFNAFAQIAADGRALGVHIVMTADRPNALPTSIASTIQQRIVLRMATEEEYVLLGVPKDILGPTSPPGRAIIDDREMQLLLLGASSNVAVQSRELATLGAAMRGAGVKSPPTIRRLPEQIWLRELPEAVAERPVIGVDDATLGPATIELRGALMVAGPPGSGKTTTVNTISRAIARGRPDVRVISLAPRRTAVSKPPGLFRSAVGAEEVAAAVPDLVPLLNDESSGHLYAVLIENVTEFSGTDAEFPLDELIKAAVRAGHFVLGESETSTWGQAWTLAQSFKAGGRGILLMPTDTDGDMLLSTNLGRINRRDFPPGRAMVVKSGRGEKVQIAAEGA